MADPNSLPEDCYVTSNAINALDESLMIGHGAFGKVYRSTLHQTPVAVKVHSDRKAWYEEAKMLWGLRHPNIVSFRGVTKPEEHLWLIMDYASYSLYDVLYKNPQARGRLREPLIASQIAIGLCYLHERPLKVVHRDLKSLNILLFEENGGFTAKIGDLGAAKFMNDPTHSYAGTMLWCAPEVGQVQWDGSADVYSFGVILFELSATLPLGHDPSRLHMDHKWKDLSLVSEPSWAATIAECFLDPVERPSTRDLCNSTKALPPINLTESVAKKAIVTYPPSVDSSRRRPFRVLCIDGGGVRGVVPARIMQEIERLAGAKIVDMFDLICGTSTGGILSALIGLLGHSPETCMEMYQKLSVKVFGGKQLFNLGGALRDRYDAASLEEELKKYCGKDAAGRDRALTDFPQRPKGPNTPGTPYVFFVARHSDYVDGRSYLFTNYPVPKEVGSNQVLAWKALRATSAANTFFPSIMIDNQEFTDGGIGANNPVSQAISEVMRLDGATDVIVSLGCGAPSPERSKKHIFGVIKQVIATATDSQKIWDTTVNTLPPAFRQRCFRFQVPDINYELDDVKSLPTIIAATTEYVRKPDVQAELKRLVPLLRREGNTMATPPSDKPAIQRLPVIVDPIETMHANFPPKAPQTLLTALDAVQMSPSEIAHLDSAVPLELAAGSPCRVKVNGNDVDRVIIGIDVMHDLVVVGTPPMLARQRCDSADAMFPRSEVKPRGPICTPWAGGLTKVWKAPPALVKRLDAVLQQPLGNGSLQSLITSLRTNNVYTFLAAPTLPLLAHNMQRPQVICVAFAGSLKAFEGELKAQRVSYQVNGGHQIVYIKDYNGNVIVKAVCMSSCNLYEAQSGPKVSSVRFEYDVQVQDYTISCLYYDFGQKVIFDPTGLGWTDLSSRTLRQCIPFSTWLGGRRRLDVVNLWCFKAANFASQSNELDQFVVARSVTLVGELRDRVGKQLRSYVPMFGVSIEQVRQQLQNSPDRDSLQAIIQELY